MICFRRKNMPEWRQQVRQLLETGNAILKKGKDFLVVSGFAESPGFRSLDF
jgi:hypothetical protein